MLDVVTVGEAMALFIAEEPGALCDVSRFRRATAGAEMNVAVGLSRLGLRVGYISRLGADSLGQYLMAFMQAEGIDLGQVEFASDASTGLMFKTYEPDGRDPRTEYYRRGSAASRLMPSAAASAYAASARHLHLTGIAPAVSPGLRDLVLELARQARQAGRTVSFDPNLRPSLWPSREHMVATLNALAREADVVMPGLEEGRLLTGCQSPEAIADFYLAHGAHQVVVKLGPDGAYFKDGQGDGRAAGVPVPRVVDTVGAGDGFAVGVVSGLLEGLSLQAAAHRGNVIGARVVQFPGDCDGLPTRAQLEG